MFTKKVCFIIRHTPSKITVCLIAIYKYKWTLIVKFGFNKIYSLFHSLYKEKKMSFFRNFPSNKLLSTRFSSNELISRVIHITCFLIHGKFSFSERKK